jgi:hypothetical protein
MSEPSAGLHLAAAIYEDGADADGVLAEAAALLLAAGVKLGGVVQRNSGGCADACFRMTLHDVLSGRTVPISDDSITAPGLCRLDASGLAAAAVFLREAIALPVEAVLVNRFGRQEALGQGLRAEMAEAVLAGLPLVTLVRRQLLPEWQAFAGDDWVALPADAAAIRDWVLGQLPAATREAA